MVETTSGRQNRERERERERERKDAFNDSRNRCNWTYMPTDP